MSFRSSEGAQWTDSRSAAVRVLPAYLTLDGSNVIGMDTVGPTEVIFASDGGTDHIIRPSATSLRWIQDPSGSAGDLLLSASGTAIAEFVEDGSGNLLLTTGGTADADFYSWDASEHFLARIVDEADVKKVGDNFIIKT